MTTQTATQTTNESAIRRQSVRSCLAPAVVSGSLSRRSKQGFLEAYCDVSNKLAGELVMFNHPLNRRLRPPVVDQYMVDMRNGDFENRTVTIMFDHDYYLVNGQHTLTALSKSGVSPMTLRFLFECDQSMVDNIDQVNKRKVRDMLRMKGKETHYMEAREALGRILFTRQIRGNLFTNTKPTSAQKKRIVESNPDFLEACKLTKPLADEAGGFLKPREAALCYYLACELGQADLGLDYLKKVALGNNMKDTDPARAVRVALQRGLQNRPIKDGKPRLPGEPGSVIMRRRAILLLGLMFTLQKKKRKLIKLSTYKTKDEETGASRSTLCQMLNEFFSGKPINGVIAPPAKKGRKRRKKR